MTTDLIPTRLMSTAEVAEILGVTRHQVKKLILQRQIDGIRFGKNGWWRVHPDEVRRLIAESTQSRSPEKNS